MEILTGGRQSGQNLYNALKLYNYIDSLQDDTTVRVVKKDGICVICVNESISIQKVKDKIEKYKNMCISNVNGCENYFKDNYNELVFRRMEQLEKELLGKFIDKLNER